MGPIELSAFFLQGMMKVVLSTEQSGVQLSQSWCRALSSGTLLNQRRRLHTKSIIASYLTRLQVLHLVERLTLFCLAFLACCTGCHRHCGRIGRCQLGRRLAVILCQHRRQGVLLRGLVHLLLAHSARCCYGTGVA